MSLQRLCGPGKAALTLPSPVARSNPFRKLPGMELGPGTPTPDMSFEQTHKRLERSSTSTPNVDRLSKAPGLIHGSAFEAPGLMRAMPPEARLLT